MPDIIRSRSRACDVCQGPQGQVALQGPVMVVTLNVVGLLLALAGVLLLFRYGMPYQTRTGGNQVRWLSGRPDPNQIRMERRYDRLGWVGLVCIVVGTVCQIIANFVPA